MEDVSEARGEVLQAVAALREAMRIAGQVSNEAQVTPARQSHALLGLHDDLTRAVANRLAWLRNAIASYRTAQRNNDCRCDDCGKPDEYAKTSDYAQCRSCEENAAERAYERSLSDYYGSSSPQTLDEQCRAAWNLKEGR